MKKVLVALLFFSIPCYSSSEARKTQIIVPYLAIRSQGANQARHLAGSLDHIYACCVDTVWGTLAATPGYSKTFRGDDITEYLFGTANIPTVTVAGSRVADRSDSSWLADYFYLPNDFKSTLNFDPVIDNFFVDFNFYIGLDQWMHGLYLNFYSPIVHSRWDLNMCETIMQKGVHNQPAGYFTPNELDRSNLLFSFTDYANGEIIGPVSQTITSANNAQIHTVFRPLKKAKISIDRLSRTRFADVRLQIGWNFIQECTHYVGMYLYIAAPTGNKPAGEYLFEPMVGNGHHWELGFGANTFLTLWQSCDESYGIRWYAGGYVDYLFDARQTRTFDLNNKPFSRYMLLERLGTPVQQNLRGGGTAPSAQFRSEFSPLANFSTIKVDVKAGPQSEITTIFNAFAHEWNFDIGYNFWYRGCETILPRSFIPLENNNQWALKGDAQVYGFLADDDGTLVQNQPVALSATQNRATITSGQNFPPGATDFLVGARNPSIDNPQPATAGTGNTRLLFAPNQVDSAENQINTSIQPVFVQATDLNLCQASNSGLSHSIFAHISYTWWENECWIPYIGFGGQAEFGGTNTYADCAGHCARCALSLWSFWFKGGISF